jgi:type IV secretion system protein TrbL
VNQLIVERFADAAGAAAEKVAAYCLDQRARLARPRNILRAILVFVCVVSAFAFGQGATPALNVTPQVQTSTTSSYAFNPASLIADISNGVKTQLDTLANNSSLQGFGSYLTAFFLVSLMVWASVRTMASGRGFGELIGEWVPIFVSFGIVSLFLDRSAGNLIVSTMNGIGSAIGGANMSTIDSAIKTCAEPIFKAIAAIVDQPRVTSATSWDSWWQSLLAGAASMIMGALAKVVTAFILVMAGVIMVATVIMAFISVQLVLLLAPIMVPFLMFRPLSWLFDSWLKFLLGACMLKIVVAFLLNVAAALLTNMGSLAMKHYTEAQNAPPLEALYVDIVLFGMMLVFALLSMLLLMQAPGIANGLLSGSSGNIGFQGIRGLTQSPGGRIAAAAPKGGLAAAGLGARGLRTSASTMKGGIDGYLDGNSMRGSSLGDRAGLAARAYQGLYNYKANRTQGPVLPRNYELARNR